MRRIIMMLTMAAAVAAVAAMSAIPAVAQANFPNAPQGTHVQTGTIGCDVSGLTVTCTPFELAGVGNTNATVSLATTYSADLICQNPGSKKKEVVPHGGSATDVQSATVTSTKNGRLLVPAQTSVAPSEADLLAGFTCPNPNWTASVAPGTTAIESFTYTLTFAGETAPAISITGP